MSLENQMAELSSAVRVLTDHLQEIQQLLAKGAPAPAAEPAPEPKPAPKTRAKKAKPAPEPEQVEQADAFKGEEPEPKPAPKPKKEETDEEAERAKVLDALRGLQSACNRQTVVDLLAKHGARTLPTLDPKKFEAVIAEAQQLADDADQDMAA